MASRRSRGKSRLARRRAHMLAATGARPGLVAAAEAVLDKPLQPFQKKILEGIEERAKRGVCSACGYSQKIKRDGNIGAHTQRGLALDCEGSGRPPK